MSRAWFQRLAGVLIVPIIIVPVAAVLQALGFVLEQPLLTAAGQAIIPELLPLVFALAVVIGFAGGEVWAALSAVVGYAVLAAVARTVADNPLLNLGAPGGLVLGAVVTVIWHRTHRWQLPEFLALFSGRRLVPTLCALVAVPLGLAAGLTWPSVVGGIEALGRWVDQAGAAGAFIYGAVDRLLLPLGLHHILNQFLEYSLGVFTDATGKQVIGEIARFYAGDPTAGRLMSGFFIFNNFNIPAIALAIGLAARPEQRRRVLGLMVTGLLTSMVTGITEPVEFAFIFASPVLWGVNALAAGLGQMLTYALGVRYWGYAAPMYVINWNHGSGHLWIPVLGVPFFIVLFGFTYWYVRRFRPPILGQVPDPLPAGGDAAAVGDAAAAGDAASAGGARAAADAAAGLAMADDAGAAGRDPGAGQRRGASAAGGSVATLARAVLAALGGPGNVKQVWACATRLRIEVFDPARTDTATLRRLGHGLVGAGTGALQLVLGPRAEAVLAVMQEWLAAGAQADVRPGGAEVNVAPVEVAPATGTPAGDPPDSAVELLAPLSGRVVPLGQVPDPVFAARLAGDGVAVDPDEGVLVAPVAGQVVHVFPGGHAVGLETPSGLELLLHVGIDTVRLQGQGFTPCVREGDAVEPGQPLVRFDLATLRAAGKEPVTPVLVTDTERVAGIEVLATGMVQAGRTPLLRVRLRQA